MIAFLAGFYFGGMYATALLFTTRGDMPKDLLGFAASLLALAMWPVIVPMAAWERIH